MVVNLDELELGEIDSFTYTVTNHGLIRADTFDLRLPTTHPFLQFVVDANIGAVEANSTIVVPVKVIDTRTRRRRDRDRRASGGCYTGSASYSFECGGTVSKGIGLTYSGGAPCGGGYSGPGGGGRNIYVGPGGGSSGPRAVTQYHAAVESGGFCDPCLKTKLECLISFIPFQPVTCGYSCGSAAAGFSSSSAADNAWNAAGCILSCVKMSPGVGTLISVLTCAVNLVKCSSGRRRRGNAALEIGFEQFQVSLSKFQDQINAWTMLWAGPAFTVGGDGKIVTNDNAIGWLGMEDSAWQDKGKAATSENSEDGVYISADERLTLLSPLPQRPDGEPVTAALVDNFIVRWNNTASYRAAGILTVADLPDGMSDNFIPEGK